MKVVYRIHNRSELQELLRSAQEWPLARPLRVTVEYDGKKRTLPQNNLLHELFSEIALHTGHTEEEIKDYLVRKLAGSERIVIAGEPHWRRKSTAKMTVAEVSVLLERVMAWAATELGMEFHMEQGC